MQNSRTSSLVWWRPERWQRTTSPGWDVDSSPPDPSGGGGPARDLDAILDPGKQTKKLLQLLWTHFSVITGYPGGPSLLGSVHEGVRDVLSWLSPVFCVLLCGNRTTEYQRTLLSRWWGGGRGAELLCDRARSVLKITWTQCFRMTPVTNQC